MALKRSAKISLWILGGFWTLYALVLLCIKGFSDETFAVISHIANGNSVAVQGLTIKVPWAYSLRSTPMTATFSGGKGYIRSRISGAYSHALISVNLSRPKLELQTEIKNLGARGMTYVDTKVIQVADVRYECHQFTGHVPAPFVPGEDTLIHCESDFEGPQFVFSGSNDRIGDFYSIISGARRI